MTAAVADVFREERGRLLASLVRQFGDLDLAEEVASDAVAAALERWPRDGVPDRPGAWLLTTARRRAVDRVRRDRALAARIALLRVEADRAEPAAPVQPDDVPDERLRLFFTCCHPALAVEAQLALTLRCLAGLTTPEVARALLVPPATAAQRIVRAKKKIRDARIPFRCPARTSCRPGSPPCCGSSTSSSPRATLPARATPPSGPTSPRRRSGSAGCCTGCSRTSRRRPGCWR